MLRLAVAVSMAGKDLPAASVPKTLVSLTIAFAPNGSFTRTQTTRESDNSPGPPINGRTYVDGAPCRRVRQRIQQRFPLHLIHTRTLRTPGP